jgi:hypothetical protein
MRSILAFALAICGCARDVPIAIIPNNCPRDFEVIQTQQINEQRLTVRCTREAPKEANK